MKPARLKQFHNLRAQDSRLQPAKNSDGDDREIAAKPRPAKVFLPEDPISTEGSALSDQRDSDKANSSPIKSTDRAPKLRDRGQTCRPPGSPRPNTDDTGYRGQIHPDSEDKVPTATGPVRQFSLHRESAQPAQSAHRPNQPVPVQARSSKCRDRFRACASGSLRLHFNFGRSDHKRSTAATRLFNQSRKIDFLRLPTFMKKRSVKRRRTGELSDCAKFRCIVTTFRSEWRSPNCRDRFRADASCSLRLHFNFGRSDHKRSTAATRLFNQSRKIDFLRLPTFMKKRSVKRRRTGELSDCAKFRCIVTTF